MRERGRGGSSTRPPFFDPTRLPFVFSGEFRRFLRRTKSPNHQENIPHHPLFLLHPKNHRILAWNSEKTASVGVAVLASILPFLKQFLPITTTTRLPLRPGKPKQPWRQRSTGGDGSKPPKIKGFRLFVGNLRCFLVKLDLASGMKIVPLTEIYLSVKFGNF